MKLATYSISSGSDVHLLTVDETRARLGGVCRNTLRKLEGNGELIPRRIDKRVFYRSVDIERFLLEEEPHKDEGLLKHVRFLISSDGSVHGLSIGPLEETFE